MKLTSLFACAVLLVLAGCDAPVQTVDWYAAHDADRNDMLKKCTNNPGELANTPNCVNANQADYHVRMVKQAKATKQFIEESEKAVAEAVKKLPGRQ